MLSAGTTSSPSSDIGAVFQRCLCYILGICLLSLLLPFRKTAKQPVSSRTVLLTAGSDDDFLLFLTRREKAFPSFVISKVLYVALGRK